MMVKSDINWEEIINLYNAIKYMYALCEETDPKLCTNLQPLNEFRAALDHLMRIVAIENVNEYKDKNALDESKRLHSHLRRAFFDICDLLSINYRNRIIDSLENYDVDEISKAIPTYYSEIRPKIEEFTEKIALLRTEKRLLETETAIDEYSNIIEELQKYNKTVVSSLYSLNEIKTKNKKQKSQNFIVQWVIPISAIIVSIAIAIFF